MKYMLAIYGKEDAWTPEEREACMIESMAIGKRLAAQGKYLDSAPLESATTAATVRVRDGQTIVTSGPFTETTEHLGGFYLLELDDLDEAISVAAQLPPAKKGTIEIRPVFTLDGLPPARPLADVENAHGGSLRPFMLMCNDNESAWKARGQEAQRQAMDRAAKLARELDQTGRYISASPLFPSETATCVRVREGRRLISDGPFTETTEVLGGYYLILAPDIETALAFAAQHPGLPLGSVEVRPVFDLASVRDKVAALPS